MSSAVSVDSLDQTLEVHDHVAPNEWRQRILPPESGLEFRDPEIMLSFAEILSIDRGRDGLKRQFVRAVRRHTRAPPFGGTASLLSRGLTPVVRAVL